MQINFIRKNEATVARQTRKGKYDAFREAVANLKNTPDGALFITDVKASSLYSAIFPSKISVEKAIYNGVEGYVVTLPEQDAN